MRTTRVIVTPYDEKWKSDFEEIKKELERAIGDLIIGIEHVWFEMTLTKPNLWRYM